MSPKKSRDSILIGFFLEKWLWIGGIYTAGNGFEWTTGEEPVFSKWRSGQPPSGTSSLCVEIVVGGTSYPEAAWVPADGAHDHLYLCEKDHA